VQDALGAIKVIINFQAFRRIESGSLALKTTMVPWFNDPAGPNTCPKDDFQYLATETLENALTQMMWISDNRRTQALRVFLGQNNINQPRAASVW
jgi:hypothetical protein